MDSWADLCRCCLSPESEVSLFDTTLNVNEKFLEVTSIQVNTDDGLPQRLCETCFMTLSTAYQFRMQCIKMDNELKLQLNSLITQNDREDNSQHPSNKEADEYTAEEIANDPFKQLEEIIKKEPQDNNDEDYYYVLVIDDQKDKESVESSNDIPVVKSEPKIESTEVVSESNQDDLLTFENSVDSFLVSNTKVPDDVPATILENEEGQENEQQYASVMDVDETHDSLHSQNFSQIEDSHDTNVQDIVSISDDIQNFNSNNQVIKILKTIGTDGTILLKSSDNITYLADSQIINEDGEALSQDEVIFCKGDDSQLQILKCDASELVIEYADDGQISTVLQQEDGTFLCDCGEQFKDLDDYEKHQDTHMCYENEDHSCNLCGKAFESAEILTGHKLLHNFTGMLIMCPFCNQLIKRNALTQHIKNSHNKIKPRCNVCLKTFANSNNLKRHMMIHSGIKQFECDLCFKRFHQKITMQTHRLTHMNPFACNECDKAFDNKTDLSTHKESNECTKSKVIKVKEEVMKTVKQKITTSLGQLLGFACSLCEKMFSLESALEQHVESTHLVDPNKLICAECGEVFVSKKEMQTHESTHKNVKNTNTKRFECSICGKGCASQAMLIMHERVHTNERPFPCHLCSLRFKTKTHLRTHQLTHTREKKFGCSVCMKFFALKGNLVVHLRTHTGERPYVCSICNEAFIDSKYLKKHKLRKHAIENVPWNQY